MLKIFGVSELDANGAEIVGNFEVSDIVIWSVLEDDSGLNLSKEYTLTGSLVKNCSTLV